MIQVCAINYLNFNEVALALFMGSWNNGIEKGIIENFVSGEK